ncbi:carbohydrate ABC transporter permease [Bosea sp. (in: a-proteobacteria)]|uniref:carbohydrate ABC transporter permease n=1 Tax=Bosea sp. (in: a-proteobacteria) TaxID=1871050 RepID=UPI00260B94AB|nr:carbohydrate ABC transporter permease [Bosea sp. (in: a-proteobacteria)]MCO5090612.1 carbohydrate ABC transporter permease [Bosea sp. (in: a-proteobacteria)]
MTLAGSHNTKRLLLSTLCLAIGVVYLFPYAWMVLTGFRSALDTLSLRFVFEPTLEGFRAVIGDSIFRAYMLNSIIVATATTALVLTVAAPAAFALAHLPIRGTGFLLFVLIVRMVPGIAILIPIYLVASRLGLLDTHGVLIVLYSTFNLPFAIWLLRGFFCDVPGEIREAAIIDGCSERQVFLKIMLPLTSSGIVATGVFVFIAAWNEFLFALALTNNFAATAPLAMVAFRSEYGVQWPSIGAAAFIISTPVVLFAVVMQRFLVRGLTMGSVKG